MKRWGGDVITGLVVDESPETLTGGVLGLEVMLATEVFSGLVSSVVVNTVVFKEVHDGMEEFVGSGTRMVPEVEVKLAVVP